MDDVAESVVVKCVLQDIFQHRTSLRYIVLLQVLVVITVMERDHLIKHACVKYCTQYLFGPELVSTQGDIAEADYFM